MQHDALGKAEGGYKVTASRAARDTALVLILRGTGDSKEQYGRKQDPEQL